MNRPIDALLAAYGQPALIADTPENVVFSVVVRTQGHRPVALNEALDSVCAQIHDDHEVIVVVHGDETAADGVRTAIGTRIGTPRLRVIHVDGGGRARPLNTGLDAATGDYVCFLDDDDLATDTWLSAFATAAHAAPSTVIRAVTLSQDWATDGGVQPLRAVGPIERPFPPRFDLLAHMSLNLTPICGVAYPVRAVSTMGLRFDEALPVYEDWEFLVRTAMALGVTSIPDETTLYRRLDHGNADTAEDEAVWHATHAGVIDRLSDHPVLLPVGSARRLAGAHFQLDGGSRHEADLETAQAEIDALTRSPVHWARGFGQRVFASARHRIGARRP